MLTQKSLNKLKWSSIATGEAPMFTVYTPRVNSLFKAIN